MSESPQRPGDVASLRASDVVLLSARDLLRIASELFAGLMAVDGPFTDADRDRALVLRLALASVASRASRVFPAALPACACSCGESFATPEELDEHFWAVFVPADDTGLDGKPHAEVVTSG